MFLEDKKMFKMFKSRIFFCFCIVYEINKNSVDISFLYILKIFM